MTRSGASGLDGLKANNVFIAADATAAYEAVLRGERQVAAAFALPTCSPRPRARRWLPPSYDAAVVRYPNSLWLLTKARHPNVGALFINWMIGEEGQRFIAAGGRTPVLNIDTDVSESKLLPAGATVFDPAQAQDYFANPSFYEKVWEDYWPGRLISPA